jgi:outer membrane protein TolC
LHILFNFSGFSQESGNFNVLEDNIESMLPPLETIIDSAIANNPEIKFRDLQIIVNKYKLSTERNLWTRDIGVQTDVRYGTFNNFSTNTSEGQSPSNIATLSSQLNYGVGAYIKLPFFDFVNRKNQVQMATTEVKQAESFAQTQRNELRQMVIKQYNDLIVKHRVLKIKSKYAETSKINMQMVEQEFTNGIISVSEYSRISEIVTRTEIDLENSRMEFLTAYMILEEITGIRFNLIR